MTISEPNIKSSIQDYADLHYGGKLTKLKTNESAQKLELFGGDGLGFDDIIDTINPLQHIPVVSSIYRAVTGDTISTAARLTGGGLFGGVLGLASEAANTLIENQTGSDIGEHIVSLVSDKTDVAENDKGFNHILSHKLVADTNIEAFIQPNALSNKVIQTKVKQIPSIAQSLEIYRNASIQLNENKQTQLQEKLIKVAIDMNS